MGPEQGYRVPRARRHTRTSVPPRARADGGVGGSPGGVRGRTAPRRGGPTGGPPRGARHRAGHSPVPGGTPGAGPRADDTMGSAHLVPEGPATLARGLRRRRFHHEPHRARPLPAGVPDARPRYRRRPGPTAHGTGRAGSDRRRPSGTALPRARRHGRRHPRHNGTRDRAGPGRAGAAPSLRHGTAWDPAAQGPGHSPPPLPGPGGGFLPAVRHPREREAHVARFRGAVFVLRTALPRAGGTPGGRRPGHGTPSGGWTSRAHAGSPRAPPPPRVPP